MLQLEDTPGFTRDNLVMTHAKHKQVSQHGDANGFLTAVLVPADLVLAQPQARFQLPVHQFDRPTFLVDAYSNSRCSHKILCNPIISSVRQPVGYLYPAFET